MKGINYVVLTLDIIGLKYTGGEASFLPFIDPPIMCNEFAPTISRRVMGVPCCMIPIGLVGVSGVLYKTGKEMRIPQYTMKLQRYHLLSSLGSIGIPLILLIIALFLFY